MKSKTTQSKLVGCICAVTLLSFVSIDRANSQDRIFMNSGTPVSGEIELLTPESFSIDDKTISMKDVKKINIGGAPRDLGRAQEDLANGRFEDALARMQKIANPPTAPMARMEFDYVNAYIKGQLALTTGKISTSEARNSIAAFIANNPKSFRYYPLVDLFGQLCISTNELDLATKSFEKLAAANWSEYQLKGLFDLGQVQMLTEDYAKAMQNFDRISNHELNDSAAQQYKLLARCQSAKAMAVQGKVDDARKTIDRLIKEQNPDNKRLFAFCYNALGACHQKNNELKAAAIAYLHTDLLFSTEADAHAEALFHLCQIWPKLEETDRANQARQMLSSAYANSFWKQKLD